MQASDSPARVDEKEALAVLLPLLGAATEWQLANEAGSKGIDFVLAGGALKLAVEIKRSSDAASIQGALNQVEEYRRAHPQVIPLVATQFMGPVGKKLCAERQIGWFDLSGNADIDAPGLRVLIEGRPNQFKRPGRPSSVFAPKASRIARWLLMYGDTGWTQQELIEGTGLDKGHASRVLKRLRGQSLIRLRGEKYFVDDPDLLLKAWQGRYDFSKHGITKGVIPVRTGEEATRRIAKALGREAYAATGLAAAWFIDGFAAFRTATVYLRSKPEQDLYDELSFVPTEKGANVWLVEPNDEGVFQGKGEHDGIVCVHPVQAYLDLQAHPERAAEAAEHLRQNHLNWRGRAD